MGRHAHDQRAGPARLIPSTAMTTPAPYPTGLPRPLASKSRSQPAAFSMREPRRGSGYVQSIGTDVPVFWDLQWRFRQSDAARFHMWVRVVLARGTLPFALPLATEFGDVEHVCQLLPDSLLPHSSEAGVHSYSAQVMARALAYPDGIEAAGEMIAGLPDWDRWGALLDLAISELPTP